MPEGSGTFAITPEMLHKASVDTRNVMENTQGHLSTLRGQLGQLQGAWKGEAFVAFQSLNERFENAAKKVLQDLNTISESLDTAAKQYGHRETDTKSAFTKQEGAFGF